MEKIMQNRLDRGFLMYKDEFEKKALDVLNSGWYVLGNEVSSFENEFAQYIGAKHCIGLASGLDALWIAFRLLKIGKGDEVIVHALNLSTSKGYYFKIVPNGQTSINGKVYR